MISRKISGLTTTMAESTAVMTTSSAIAPRYRRRYGQTRRAVPGRTCCWLTSSSKNRNRNPGLEIMGPTIPRTPRQAANHFPAAESEAIVNPGLIPGLAQVPGFARRLQVMAESRSTRRRILPAADLGIASITSSRRICL